MSIASEDRPVWDSDIDEESLRPHTSLPDSDDERLARQMDDAQAHAQAMANPSPAAVNSCPALVLLSNRLIAIASNG